MNVSKKELYRDLRNYPDAKWDQSPLFKKLYEQEFGQLGGEPYGCLVGDYYFDHSAPDVRLLRDLGKIAAVGALPRSSRAPRPTLMGMDSWTELSNPRDLSKIFETPDYAAWKSLRDSENSRYVGLCMPRVLAREPYGAKTLPVEEFAFEETDRRPQGREICLDERGLCDGRQHQPRLQGIWLDGAHPRRAVGRRGDQPADPCLPDRRRQRRPEVPDRNRHQRPPRSRTVEVGALAGHPPQEHRQGRLHRRAVGLPAEEI